MNFCNYEEDVQSSILILRQERCVDWNFERFIQSKTDCPVKSYQYFFQLLNYISFLEVFWFVAIMLVDPPNIHLWVKPVRMPSSTSLISVNMVLKFHLLFNDIVRNHHALLLKLIDNVKNIT